MVVTPGWAKTYGGAGDADVGSEVGQTLDGGYIVAGYTNSYGAGNRDAWLVKTDAAGETVWTRTYGGTGDDRFSSVQQTADGGYVATGFTMSFGAGGCDVWLVKTDARGDEEWDRTFGGTAYDCGSSVQQTQDGGYVVFGSTMSRGAGDIDAWLIKTDVKGDTVWTRTFGGAYEDVGYSVCGTRDGGCILAGRTESFGAGGPDVWVVKVDASGDTVWTKTFGGSEYDRGNSVRQTSDGGYIVVGVTYSYGQGVGDLWLIRTDADGNEMWDKVLGGALSDWGRSVRQTADGGYIIVAGTESRGAGGCDAWLLKTDANGDTVWTRTFGGIEDDVGNSVEQDRDGGYIITGCTSSYGAGGNDAWVIKTDAEGRADGSGEE